MSGNQKKILITGMGNVLVQDEGLCAVEELGVELDECCEPIVGRWGKEDQRERAECA